MNRPAKTINERASIRATPNNKRRFRQPPGYYAQVLQFFNGQDWHAVPVVKEDLGEALAADSGPVPLVSLDLIADERFASIENHLLPVDFAKVRCLRVDGLWFFRMDEGSAARNEAEWAEGCNSKCTNCGTELLPSGSGTFYCPIAWCPGKKP